MTAFSSDGAVAEQALAEAPELVSPAAPQDIQAEPERSEIDRLDPIGRRFILMSGVEVEIMPLKLRQFLKFLRILSSGAAEIWGDIRPSLEDDAQFMRDLVGIAIFAIPEAEEQTIDFIKSMVSPAGLPTGNDDVSRKQRLVMWGELSTELDNPELEDTISIIQSIIECEAKDLMALGKRLRRMFGLVTKSGMSNLRA